MFIMQIYRALFRLAIVFYFYIFSQFAQAEILASQQILSPLSPSGGGHVLHLSPSEKLDPNQPVWVKVDLLAVSADADPKGEIKLDISFEMIPFKPGDDVLRFSSQDLSVNHGAGTLTEKLKAQIGDISDSDLQAKLGDDLYAAYKALAEKRGAILQGSTVKHFAAFGKTDTMLNVIVEKATGMQPLMLQFTIGQGEIPITQDQIEKTKKLDKFVAGLIFFGLVLLYWWFARRKKS